MQVEVICSLKFKIIMFFVITLSVQFHVRVGILFTCGKHLYDPIISLRKEILVHIISLTLPLFIEVTLPSQESERSYICVLRVSILVSDFQNCSDNVLFLFFILFRLNYCIIQISVNSKVWTSNSSNRYIYRLSEYNLMNWVGNISDIFSQNE